MEDKTNEIASETVQSEDSQAVEVAEQNTVVSNVAEGTTDASQQAEPAGDIVAPESTTETAVDTVAQEPSAEQVGDTVPVESTEPVGDSQGKKKKKKDKKDKKPAAESKPKKEPKVGLYVASLFKYFNIITLLPFALLMYAVFFSSYIVDKGDIFQKNLVWICVILGVGAAIMIGWFITTIKKRRVCSFDAFLLMALLICASMIAQCIIFKNFNSFDGIAIATLAATVAVFILLTVRLIMFKPSEQHKNDDAKYNANNKLVMYFKVIFTKYVFFIAMLCVIGALLILILTQSKIFEDFSVVASQTEQIVTIVFAGLAAVLMIVGIFIRIVRGRANVIDCMPYMLFLVALGGLIYFIMRHTYQILYIAIGSLVVGIVWLFLCQYTLLMSNYKKAAVAEGEASTEPTDSATATADATSTADSTVAVDTAGVADTTTADASTADEVALVAEPSAEAPVSTEPIAEPAQASTDTPTE